MPRLELQTLPLNMATPFRQRVTASYRIDLRSGSVSDGQLCLAVEFIKLGVQCVREKERDIEKE